MGVAAHEGVKKFGERGAGECQKTLISNLQDTHQGQPSAQASVLVKKTLPTATLYPYKYSLWGREKKKVW